MSRIKAMSEALAAVPFVEQVFSLSSTPMIRASADGLDIRPLFDDVPTDPSQLKRLKKTALQNPLFAESLLSKDGLTTVWFAFPDLRKSDTTELRIQLFEQADAAAKKHLEGFEVHLEGIPTVKRYMVLYIERAILLFGLVSALLLAVALFFTFRTIRGVLLPGAVVFLTLIWTLGLCGLAGGVLDSVSSLIFALIMVVGVGDTIHILVHFLEEYFKGHNKRDALILTMERMFVPCLLTSVTTSIGFLSLMTIRIPPIRNFGLLSACGVMFAFLISIIFAPAVLALLSAPAKKQKTRYFEGRLTGYLTALGRFNENHRIAVLIGALVIVALSLAGIFRIRVETRVSEFFHSWSPIVRGYKFLEKNVTPPVPLEIMFEADTDVFKQPETWRWMEQLSEEVLKIPLVKRTESYANVLKEMNWAMAGGDQVGAVRSLPDSREAIAQLSMLFEMGDPDTFERFMGNNFDRAHMSLRVFDSGSKELVETIEQIRKLLGQIVPKDVRWAVTGGTVIFVSAVNELTKGQVKSLALALVVVSLLITILFRSLKIGLLSMIPNVLPILMMLGIMGWFGFPLDTNTVMIGPITLGIAVDDTIHYITRYRRQLNAGDSSIEAMKRTLTTTGRALTSTSLILSLGFSVTILSSFRPQSILGGLGALTILLALVADLIVLPAVMLTFFRTRNKGNGINNS